MILLRLILLFFCPRSKVHLKFAAFVYLFQLLLYHIFLFIIVPIALRSFLALLFIVSMFSMVSPKNLLVNILSFLGQQAKQQRAAPTRRRTRPHAHHLTPSPRGLVLGLLGFGRAFRTPTWKFNASTRWQPSSDRLRWRRRPVQMPDSRCRCPCSMFVVRCSLSDSKYEFPSKRGQQAHKYQGRAHATKGATATAATTINWTYFVNELWEFSVSLLWENILISINLRPPLPILLFHSSSSSLPLSCVLFIICIQHISHIWERFGYLMSICLSCSVSFRFFLFIDGGCIGTNLQLWVLCLPRGRDRERGWEVGTGT